MSEHDELSLEVYFTFVGEWKFIPVSYLFVLSASLSVVLQCATVIETEQSQILMSSYDF